MLDKGQIKDWDGTPEEGAASPPAPQSKIDRAISAIFESRDAVPTGEHVKLTPEQAHARKRRGQWIALALLAFVIIVFTLTMTKMGASILVRDL
jgi:hypothetical protein